MNNILQTIEQLEKGEVTVSRIYLARLLKQLLASNIKLQNALKTGQTTTRECSVCHFMYPDFHASSSIKCHSCRGYSK